MAAGVAVAAGVTALVAAVPAASSPAPAAGPCLAASFEKDSLHLVIVVMNTKTMDNRWVEVPKLTLWAINRLNKMCEYFAENQLPSGALKAPPQVQQQPPPPQQT